MLIHRSRRYFKRGYITISNNKSKFVSVGDEPEAENRDSGFNVHMTFADGYGVGRNSGEHKNQVSKLDAHDLGVNDSFSMTPNLRKLLTENGNAFLWLNAFPDYTGRAEYARGHLSKETIKKVSMLLMMLMISQLLTVCI